MIGNRVWYEIRLAWKALLLTPLIVIVPVGLFALLQHLLQQSSARLLLAGVEMLLPMAAGVIVATTLAHDDALEIHLTTPRSYAATGALRLLIIGGWIACLALLSLGGIAAFGLLYLPDFARSDALLVRLALLQLVWLAPLLWLVAVGFCLALLTKNRTASGALLGGIWLLDLIFVGAIAQTGWLRPFLLFPATLVLFPATHITQADFNTYWLTTRFWLIGMALVLLPLGWLLLHDTESLLKGATEE